jgi:hypothetical protein
MMLDLQKALSEKKFVCEAVESIPGFTLYTTLHFILLLYTFYTLRYFTLFRPIAHSTLDAPDLHFNTSGIRYCVQGLPKRNTHLWWFRSRCKLAPLDTVS